MKLLLFAYFLTTGARCQNWTLLQEAPPKAAARRNPMEGNERARRAGAKLYARKCSSCHGMNAEGSEKAPPLRSAEVHQAPAGTLFWVLENGSLHHGMPSFAHLPEPQRWQIVTYLCSLNQKKNDRSTAPLVTSDVFSIETLREYGVEELSRVFLWIGILSVGRLVGKPVALRQKARSRRAAYRLSNRRSPTRSFGHPNISLLPNWARTGLRGE